MTNSQFPSGNPSISSPLSKIRLWRGLGRTKVGVINSMSLQYVNQSPSLLPCEIPASQGPPKAAFNRVNPLQPGEGKRSFRMSNNSIKFFTYDTGAGSR
jgi:hypothetical protein